MPQIVQSPPHSRNKTNNTPNDGQPSSTTFRRSRISGGSEHGDQTNNGKALSLCGKLIVTLFGVATILLCMGMFGTIVAPELPSITVASAASIHGGDGNEIDVGVMFLNPNEKGFSYSNVTLIARCYRGGERVSGAGAASVVAAAPEFEQGGGGGRIVRFRVRGLLGFELGLEVEIEFRARVRYGGKSWPAKPESDVRAKCKRVRVLSRHRHVGSAIENPNCTVEGLWRTARIAMLGSTLMLPFLVVVFLSFNSCCTTSTSDHSHF